MATVHRYTDFMAWIDAVEGENLSEIVLMQASVFDSALTDGGLSIAEVLIWMETHAFAEVHYLVPEFPLLEGHVFEFTDILDVDAFTNAWGRYDDNRPEPLKRRPRRDDDDDWRGTKDQDRPKPLSPAGTPRSCLVPV